MIEPTQEAINKAATGDKESLAKIYNYLKEYSATLNERNKELLSAEKCRIIIKGLSYKTSKKQSEEWGKLLDDMVIKIKSAEITNLN